MTSPKLLCFPTDDKVFAAFARATMQAGQFETPEDFEAEVRRVYPAAAVRERLPFAQLEDGTAWYVFRDGAVRGDQRARFWSEEDGLAS